MLFSYDIIFLLSMYLILIIDFLKKNGNIYAGPRLTLFVGVI